MSFGFSPSLSVFHFLAMLVCPRFLKSDVHAVLALWISCSGTVNAATLGASPPSPYSSSLILIRFISPRTDLQTPKLKRESRIRICSDFEFTFRFGYGIPHEHCTVKSEFTFTRPSDTVTWTLVVEADLDGGGASSGLQGVIQMHYIREMHISTEEAREDGASEAYLYYSPQPRRGAAAIEVSFHHQRPRDGVGRSGERELALHGGSVRGVIPGNSGAEKSGTSVATEELESFALEAMNESVPA
nr:hypothetical protein Iba_chr05eCG11510 [Ipomoea batatas]